MSVVMALQALGLHFKNPVLCASGTCGYGQELAGLLETAPHDILTPLTSRLERIYLRNGKPVKLAGGNVHHDNGPLGAMAFDRAEERRVELMKAHGFNAIRTAHNPPSSVFLDACDRLGMLVMDEAFDCWRDGKNPHDYHVVFDDWWQRDLSAMVLRDRNHPSVIMWSIGNEVVERDGYGEGYALAHRLADHVRAVDPTRPVTAAIEVYEYRFWRPFQCTSQIDESGAIMPVWSISPASTLGVAKCG